MKNRKTPRAFEKGGCRLFQAPQSSRLVYSSNVFNHLTMLVAVYPLVHGKICMCALYVRSLLHLSVFLYTIRLSLPTRTTSLPFLAPMSSNALEDFRWALFVFSFLERSSAGGLSLAFFYVCERRLTDVYLRVTATLPSN